MLLPYKRDQCIMPTSSFSFIPYAGADGWSDGRRREDPVNLERVNDSF